MPEYVVYMTTGATFSVAINAETPEAAAEAALREGAPGLCHQCAAIDLGDWDVADGDVEEAL